MSTASQDPSPSGQLAPPATDQSRPHPQDNHPSTRQIGRVWAQKVEVAAASFRARLNAIEAREKLRDPPDAEIAAICDGVKDLLRMAEKAARGQYPRHYPFVSWWRGTNIEAAFQNIHQAESELVRLYSDDEVDAEVPEALARTEIGLNRDHPMRMVARGLSQMNAGSAKRTMLSKGGSLAAAVSIRNLRGTSTPYDIPIALALLKIPAGALTALGALIAIRGQFIPGLSALDTQEQILAYALIFGYAQQLLTGTIDRRALDLLDTVPSKDPEQSRPALPPTDPAVTTGDGQAASGATRG